MKILTIYVITLLYNDGQNAYGVEEFDTMKRTRLRQKSCVYNLIIYLFCTITHVCLCWSVSNNKYVIN